MGYPTGPLPQTPKSVHLPPVPPASPGYKFPHDPSSDSLISAQRMQNSGKQITDSPQLSSSGRGSGRTDDSTDSGMSIPRAPTPPSQPLGLPKAHKLVPGRMTTQKERKREIPSTAVWRWKNQTKFFELSDKLVNKTLETVTNIQVDARLNHRISWIVFKHAKWVTGLAYLIIFQRWNQNYSFAFLP